MKKVKRAFCVIAPVMIGNKFRIILFKFGGIKIGEKVSISRKSKIIGNSIIGDNVKINDNCKLDNANLGNNVSISYNVTLRYVKLGNNTTIEPFSILQGNPINGIEIGNDTYLSSHSTLESKASIKIGNHVSIGPNLRIVTHTGHLQALSKAKIGSSEYLFYKPVMIKDSVYIGVGSIIQMGVTIGSFSIVNAGSIVTKSIPQYSFVQGAPARVVAKVDFVNNEPILKKL